MTHSEQAETGYFVRAVALLGESQPVISSCAIFSSKGVKIIEKGVAINLKLYDRLMQHKLSAPIESCVTSVPSITGQSLRSSAERIMSGSAFYGRMGANINIRRMILNAIDKVPLPDAMAFQLALAQGVRPEIFERAVRTAITAAWLEHEPMSSQFDVGNAAAAGLLHDIGMLHVDPVLFSPTHELDRGLRRQLYAHPLISKALIESHHVYDKNVVSAVAQHHEYMDGSGYPSNLSGTSISRLGRILSLAEVVDAMFESGSDTPELRLSVALRMNPKRYDNRLVAKLLGILKPEFNGKSDDTAVTEDPTASLLKLDALIVDGPAALMQLDGLSPSRRGCVEWLNAQAYDLRRTLAGVGAAPDQLRHLGNDSREGEILQELRLLESEGKWQLRSLARQVRRRWKLAPDDAFPNDLLLWLEAIDAFIGKDTDAQITADTLG